jgi:hypothetical protein
MKYNGFLNDAGWEEEPITDARKNFAAFSANLAKLPRITREFFAIMIERREIRIRTVLRLMPTSCNGYADIQIKKASCVFCKTTISFGPMSPTTMGRAIIGASCFRVPPHSLSWRSSIISILTRSRLSNPS